MITKILLGACVLCIVATPSFGQIASTRMERVTCLGNYEGTLDFFHNGPVPPEAVTAFQHAADVASAQVLGEAPLTQSESDARMQGRQEVVARFQNHDGAGMRALTDRCDQIFGVSTRPQGH